MEEFRGSPMPREMGIWTPPKRTQVNCFSGAIVTLAPSRSLLSSRESLTCELVNFCVFLFKHFVKYLSHHTKFKLRAGALSQLFDSLATTNFVRSPAVLPE
jgi:hypothetical protein